MTGPPDRRRGDPLVGLEFVRASVARAAGGTADARLAATSINAFALDLYERMRSDPDLNLEGRNIVFSPTSSPSPSRWRGAARVS